MNPPQVNKFHKSLIYKITNDINEDCFIGVTTDRMLASFNRHKQLAKTRPSILHTTMKTIGLEHFKAELVEEYKCENVNELNARQKHWIEQLNPTLNMANPIALTHEERLAK